MSLGIVVQARTSSARLPGKVLMPLAGKPLLQHLVSRLHGTGLPIVVATSGERADDGVEALARKLGVRCHRGPLDDVAARLHRAAGEAGFEAFVRANGDSPLLDPALVRQARELHEKGGCDLVGNVFPRSFPKGMSVEIVALAALERVLASTEDAQDREHVTRYIYAHPDDFRIRNFTAARPRAGLQLSIDTREDFERIEAAIQRLGPRAADAGWEEIADEVEAAA